MAIHGEKIDRMLGTFGWELVEARTVAELWVAEIWLVRSTWSPTDCHAYLTFEIDGECDSRDVSKVWAIKASLSRPDDWFTENRLGTGNDDIDIKVSTGNLSIQKEKYLDELFSELANLREKFAVSAY